MKKIILVYFILFISNCVIYGQNKTYLGFEIGYKGDVFSMVDNGGMLVSQPVPGGAWGISLGQEIKKNIILETGVYKVNYWTGIGFKETFGYSSASSMNSVQFPIRLKTRLPLYKNKLSITPYVGYKLGINQNYIKNQSSDYMNGTGSGGVHTTNDTISYSSNEYSNMKFLFSLLETGVSLDYRFRRGLEFSVSAKYSAGLDKIAQEDITYSINGAQDNSAYTISHGNNIQVLVGMRYPISTIWQNKTERVAAKPEKTEKIVNASQNGFYVSPVFGFELYKLSNNNPSIVGKVKNMSAGADRDVSYGLIAGYKMSENIGIESGLIVQRFTNYYYFVDKDGRMISGGGFWSSGNNYLRIPVNVKYFYYITERLALTGQGGVSMLTHSNNVGSYDKSISSIYSIDQEGNRSPLYNDQREAFWERKANLLLNAGLGLELALSPSVIFTLKMDYNLGFNDINRLHVYKEYEGETYEGDVLYNGTGGSFSCGLKVPLGKK